MAFALIRSITCLIPSHTVRSVNTSTSLIRSADAHTAELVQIPMKLQDHTGFYRDILIAFVDGSQHITVTSDFFFTAVTGVVLSLTSFFKRSSEV